ncbi:hypothetical protein Slala02_00510 [Streptomyces lavendulae subsp. lavendulae]|nr:hypothetical protein Slala01_63470 [Streptomyces lavendulae subsp. lavendulae]GLX24231.1 hypothetical protein Slala02_00510 [Streptomyces lavendulae subsp. lavendulae]
MSDTACEVVGDYVHVAATDEVAELAWVPHADISEYVPYRLFEPAHAVRRISGTTVGPGLAVFQPVGLRRGFGPCLTLRKCRAYRMAGSRGARSVLCWFATASPAS